MATRALASCLLASCVLLLPSGALASSEADPAPLPATDLRLFAQHNETAYWLSAEQEDPAATDGAAGYGAGDVALTVLAGGDGGSLGWSFPLHRPLVQPVELDVARPAQFTLYLALRPQGDDGPLANQTVPGSFNFDLSVLLRQGNGTVANATLTNATGNATFREYNLTAPLESATLDPALGELNWTVTVSGAGLGYVLGLANSTGHSRLQLPLLPPPPAATAEAAPLPPGPPPIPTVTVTKTQTVTWTRTMTVGYTFRMDQAETQDKSLPGMGLAAGAAALVLVALVRRRLA